MQIFHGDNQIASRADYLRARADVSSRGVQIIEIYGDVLTLSQLMLSLQNVSMFGDSNAVFIDGFFSRRPSSEKAAISKYLQAHPDLSVYFFDDSDVSIQLKGFPATSVRKFDLPKYLFAFLDQLTLDSLHQAFTGAAPEQVFSLLVRQMHNLILVSSGSSALPSWQAGKLRSLLPKFTKMDIFTAYRKLLEIDYRQKTSASVFDMAASLEIWVCALTV